MNDSANIKKELLIAVKRLTTIEIIGEGSYGQVWKGKMDDVIVAIKKIVFYHPSRQVLACIEKEIESLAILRHPHVLSIFRACVYSPAEYWIVTEFADGGSLYSMLSNEALQIPWHTRWTWIKEILSAVAYLHTYGIIHRDIKSPNFLLVKGSIKVCDFGMATSKLNSRSRKSSTSSENIVGTIRWKAPECTAKTPVYNEKTDMYSIGIVIWEIVTREIPFGDVEEDMQVIILVNDKKQRPNIPSDCPHTISELINRCWDDSPDARPSAEDAVNIIEQEIEKHTVTEHTHTLSNHSSSPVPSFNLSSPLVHHPSASSPLISSSLTASTHQPTPSLSPKTFTSTTTSTIYSTAAAPPLPKATFAPAGSTIQLQEEALTEVFVQIEGEVSKDYFVEVYLSAPVYHLRFIISEQLDDFNFDYKFLKQSGKRLAVLSAKQESMKKVADIIDEDNNIMLRKV